MKHLTQALKFLAFDMASTLVFLALFLLTGNVLLSVALSIALGVAQFGWQNRYQPPIALELMPDIVVIFGFLWAGLMLLSAILNVLVAMNASVLAWASFMSAYAIVSKAALVLIQFTVMKSIGRRRRRGRARLPNAVPT